MSGLAIRSAGCSAHHDVPPAHGGIEAFTSAVAEVVANNGYGVVFGAGEAEVLALSIRRNEIQAVVPYGDHDSIVVAMDKVGLDELARSVGFSTPERADPALISDDGPYAVKARLHARPEIAGLPPRIDTNVVRGCHHVRERVRQIQALGAEPYVQRFYDGPLLAYTAVVDRDHRVVGDCMQIATHIWPPLAGASCRSSTIGIDDDIALRAEALFTSLGWFGLAELQFVVAPSSDPMLIDFNGRFYGSLKLAVAAGVNLPAMWAAVAVGLPVERQSARAGVRYQWLEGDLRRALIERRRGTAVDVIDTLRSARWSSHSIIDVRDPAPAAAHLGSMLRRRVKAVARRRP